MSTYKTGAIDCAVMAELYRSAKEAMMVIHKPASGWSDPDPTIHYPTMEAFDALCYGFSDSGEPLYYGYTAFQVMEMAEWSLSGLQRHLVAEMATSADTYLLGLVRSIRHQQEQAVKNYDPFAFIKAIAPDLFSAAGYGKSAPPNLVVMPKPRRGRPQTAQFKRESLMMEVYFFRYFFIPNFILPIMVANSHTFAHRMEAEGMRLVHANEVEPMSFDTIAAIMNIGKNSSPVKVPGMEDALSPDSYRKLCKKAEKEAKKDPEWFHKTRLRHIHELGFTSLEEYTAATQLPQVIDMTRDRSDTILDLLADRARQWMIKRSKTKKTPELIH